MSAVVIPPPGGTFFDTMKRSFADVPINTDDNGIATTEFLEAAESMTTIFGTICTDRIALFAQTLWSLIAVIS